MIEWNFADVWERAVDLTPEAAAVIQGQRTVTWAEFGERADALAAHLLAGGVRQQDKVALYLYNCPEYLEGLFAAFKTATVPVNTNYRYGDNELIYLWDNADATVVIFHGAFTATVDRVRHRLPNLVQFIHVDDGTEPCPQWATPYESIKPAEGRHIQAPWGRHGDDYLFLYTGGTTGLPKGVMWRQDDLFCVLSRSGFRHYDLDAGLEGVTAELETHGAGSALLPAPPLMHGTGCFTAIETLSEAGTVVLLESRQFNPVELLEAIERNRVAVLVIVGDPFARPIRQALDADPGRFDLSSLMGIISSGAMWSEEIKQGLLAHHPNMLLIDAFSSSEALGIGTSVSSAAGGASTAQFALGPQVRVIDAEGIDVVPGSQTPGVLALGGRLPVGYYKDESKSEATFKIIDGVRYSVPGDYALVRADGTIHLLGRGSVCINTGGEKVFPEEVEETLKTHPSVSDAVVVGVPCSQLGQQIVAAVEAAPGHQADEATLIAHVQAHLARYKAPKRIRVVPSIGRTPAGKVDYGRHLEEATAWVTPVA